MRCQYLQFPASVWLVFWALTGWAFSQESGWKSIHQLESERYRDLVIKPSQVPVRLYSQALSAAPNVSRTVFGFLPYWRTDTSQIRFKDLTHLAVFSVEADGSGQLVNLRGWPNAQIIQAAHQANVRVILVCTLFSSSQLLSLLSSPQTRQALCSNLKDQVLRGGADGVNIDFEGVPGSQRANLVLFMKELAASLRETVPGAHVSIDTPAVDWSSAYDYATLADICDSLMIMAYDYHWSSSTSPGPVSPLAGSALWGKYSVGWTVADYLAKVGTTRSQKLVVGVPYYGYDWPAQNEALNTAALGSASSVMFTTARATAASYGRRWDEFSSTPWYFYTSQTPHQTWYDDAASLALKYDLVFGNDLQGIGIWALTYDNGSSELWSLIEQKFTPGLPEAPMVVAPSTFFDTVGLPIAIRERGGIPASGFEVAVGATPGGQEVSGFRPVGFRHQLLITGLALNSGATYYVIVRGLGPDGAAGAASDPASVTIDTSTPVTHKYLPCWISSPDLYTGLAMVNGSESRRAIWIRAHVPGESSGQDSVMDTAWVLDPWQQLAQLVSQPDLLGSDAVGRKGWLELIYQGDGLHTMYLVGDNRVSRSLAGSPLLDAGVKQVVPELDEGRTRIYAANPGNVDATVNVTLVGAAYPRPRVPLILAQGGLFDGTVADLFPNYTQYLTTDYSPFILLESDRPVASTSFLQRDADSAAIPALDATRLLSTGDFSYFVIGGGYQSRVVLVNPTSESQSAALHYTLGGATIDQPVYFGGAGAVSIDLGSGNIAGEALRQGSVSVGSSGAGILGSIWMRTAGSGMMAALPLEAGGAQSYVFPQIAQTQGYWTGMSVSNPGIVKTDVTIEALDSTGTSVGTYRMLDLKPGETRVGLIYEWIRSTLGMNSGTVKVSAAGPVLVAEIFGNDALTFMASVPGR